MVIIFRCIFSKNKLNHNGIHDSIMNLDPHIEFEFDAPLLEPSSSLACLSPGLDGLCRHTRPPLLDGLGPLALYAYGFDSDVDLMFSRTSIPCKPNSSCTHSTMRLHQYTTRTGVSSWLVYAMCCAFQADAPAGSS